MSVLAVCIGGLATTRTAAADARPKIAILDLAVSGDAPKEVKKALLASLGGGLYAAGYEVIPNGEVQAAITASPGLAGCTTPTCLQQLSDKLMNARAFVRGRVRADGSTYQIELELLTTTAGEGGNAARIEDSCEICTLPEVNTKMSDAALKLHARAQELAGAADAVFRVTISSEPPGATVRIDGADVGTTMLSTDLASGRHSIEVRYAGYHAKTAELTVTREGPNELNVVLERAPVRWKKTRPRLLLGIAALGAGVIAAGIGIGMIAVDGDGTCSDDGECPDVYDTMIPGAISVTAGVVLIAGGIYFITRTRSEQVGATDSATNQPRIRVLPALGFGGGAGVVALGHF